MVQGSGGSDVIRMISFQTAIKFLLLGTLAGISSQPTHAADGPKNSLVLRFANFDAHQPLLVTASLQGYRTELGAATKPFKTDETVSTADTLKDWLKRSVHLTAGRGPCILQNLQTTEAPRVIGGTVSWQCSKATKYLGVALPNSNLLPNDFTVSVRGASGHQALSWMNAETNIWTDPVTAEVLAGWQWVTGGSIPSTLELGRQAPVWFGGLELLPWGYGSLLLLGLILLSNLSSRRKIALICLGSATAWLIGGLLLRTNLTQFFFGLVYSTHLYFGLLAVLGLLIIYSAFRRRELRTFDKRGRLTVAVIGSLAWLCLGIELAFMGCRCHFL